MASDFKCASETLPHCNLLALEKQKSGFSEGELTAQAKKHAQSFCRFLTILSHTAIGELC